MQPKSISSFSLDSSDWAFWLDSIAIQSNPHATLAEVEDRVQFLTEREKKDLHQQGLPFQNLTMDKIIEITENFWKDSTIEQAEKTQMLNGIRYIYQKRQARYERLFWLVRIFAKLRGVEGKLVAEKQAIERLDAELNHQVPLSDESIPNTADPIKPIKPTFHSKLPAITKPVVVFDKKARGLLEGIKKEVDELIKQKDRLLADEKKEWYEKLFSLEKKLYHVTQKLPQDLLLKMHDLLDELNKTLAAENQNIPRFKEIIQLFGDSAIQSSLSATLSTLCANHVITDRELDRDQILFQCSRLEVEAMYIKRLIKAKRTDLSLSLVTAIERTWEEIKDSNKEGETKTFDLGSDRWRVIFLPKDKEIYIKEDYLSEGSYKAAFEITPFHNLETKEQRSKLVILQSLPVVFTEIEEHKAKRARESSSLSEREESPSGLLSATQPPKVQDEVKKDKQSKSGIDSLSSSSSGFSSVVIHRSLSQASNPTKSNSPKAMEDAKEKLVASKGVEKEKAVSQPKKQGSSHKLTKKISEISGVVIKKTEKNLASASKGKVSKHSSNKSLEEDEGYKKEAENCLLYGKLPGIWPTFKVITVDGRIAIVQSKASYLLQTTTGEAIKAINLEDMCILLDHKLLNKKDQLAFIKMVKHSLIGVESLHKLDIIHRDLKPQNILCANDGTSGVSDLGTICASTIEVTPGSGKRKPNIEKMDVAGTPNYISPEMALYGNSIRWAEINIAVDIWSLGLILWEAFSGEPLDKHPVHLSLGKLTRVTALGIVRLISEILSNKKMRGDIYKKLYPEPKEKSSLAHLVWSCTRPLPSQRPTIEEVIVRYEAWAKYAEDKMKVGKIQSIRETFHDAVV